MVFHGPSGSGKKTLVHAFLQRMYSAHPQLLRSHVLHVNCSHGKGIKFIREDVKQFAKTVLASPGVTGSSSSSTSTTVHTDPNTLPCKTIVMIHADTLTMDAQSALRRCIELYSASTRFLLVAENKHSLMKPILSRFCDIYVPEPLVDGVPTNLHQYQLRCAFPHSQHEHTTRMQWLQSTLIQFFGKPTHSLNDRLQLCTLLYEKAYAANDVLQLLTESTHHPTRHPPLPQYSTLPLTQQYDRLLCFDKVKRELRNEILLLWFVLTFAFVHIHDTTECTLATLSFM
jgi:hypothetical protein